MSLTAQQKRDKEARIQARKEIRDQKKKEVREEKRLNKAKDNLRQRWEENGWKIYEQWNGELDYHFWVEKEKLNTPYIVRINIFSGLCNDKIATSINFLMYDKNKLKKSSPYIFGMPEFGLAYEQYRRTQKMLEEKYAKMNKTIDEEVERVEHIISKVEDPEYRHGKHKKYHKELLRELNKTLDSTKKQVKNKTNNINNSKNTKSKKDNKKERERIEKS